MNTLPESELIAACDAFIEEKMFEEALALLEHTKGVITTWLRGKIHLVRAQTIAADFIFQHYATPDMKMKYRDILRQAHEHLFNTVMCLCEARVDIREYLNPCLWRQLGQTENELARTKYWDPRERDEDENQEEQDWTPDPNNLIDYIEDLKL